MKTEGKIARKSFASDTLSAADGLSVLIVTVCVATVTVPARGEPVGFAATPNVTVPLALL